MTGSGIDAESGGWTPAFEGQRPPFQPGHSLSLKHGGRAVLANQPRARELADELRPALPAYEPVDEPVLQLLCLCLARVEKMVDALAQVDEGPDEPPATHRLREELRAQTSQARRLAADLGASPAARAALVGDVAQIAAIRAHLHDRYGGAG